MNNLTQYYEILGLETTASSAEIKQAYRNLAKKWHPDRFIDQPQLIEQAQKEIQKINQAYEILKAYINESTNNSVTLEKQTTKTPAEFYYQRGIELAEAEQYQQAITEFSQAIKLDCSYIKAYQYRGFIFSKLGYERRADADFQIVAQLKLQQKTQSPEQQITQKVKNKPKSWQCIYKLLAHQKAVSCLDITSDNKFFASGSHDNTIKLWELETGQAITTLRGHSQEINCLTIINNGQNIISGSKDTNIYLWDLKQKKIISNLGRKFLGYSKAIIGVVFDRKHNILISVATDNVIKLWDLNKGKEIKNFISQSEMITCIALDPNNGYFCSGGLEKQLRIREIKTGKVIRSLRGDSGIISITFSLDGKLLATGQFNRNIQIWNLETGEKIKSFTGHQERISCLKFSFDNKILISGSWDNTIKIWDIETATEIETLVGHTDKISSIAIASHGRTIISGSNDCSIRIWRR